jgi:hypothetical protein
MGSATRRRRPYSGGSVRPRVIRDGMLRAWFRITVVGQDSIPISTAIRSFRQNSSSWSRRRATASNAPSSKKALFRLVMVPPKKSVGDAVTPRFVPARAEERMSMIPSALNSIQQNGRFWDWRKTGFSTGRELWKSTVRSYLSAPAGNLATHY